ncbi:MAG: FtsX-like permease family protein [Bacteroidales bacterium]|nr:FtsX-like permease family protein [Bacteroidales bacterium]
MIRSYLSIALSNLWKNKFFTSINIIGLSVALFIAFNVLVYLLYQFSFDKQHSKRDRTFLVQSYLEEFQVSRFRTAYPVAQALKNEFPEIEKACRYSKVRYVKLQFNNEYVNAANFYAIDDGVFDVFNIPLIDNASTKNIKLDINSLLISEKIAQKFFGDKNPIGESIQVQINDREFVFTIKDVFKNVPVNSTFRPDYLCNIDVSIYGLNKYYPNERESDMKTSWTRRNWYTYILLSENHDVQDLEKKLNGFVKEHGGENIKTELLLQPFASLHNDHHIYFEILIILLVLGLLVVFVAAANYIILSSALSIQRSKEIAIRKVMGAKPADIRKQFLGESIILALLALPFSILFFKLFLPIVMPILEIPIDYVGNHFYNYLPYFALLSIFIGFLSGAYVSYHLANISIVDVLKIKFIKMSSNSFFRKSLIIFQLFIVIILMVSVLTIRLQYNYSQKMEMGFIKDDIVLINFPNSFKKVEVYLEKIKNNPNIIASACAMKGPPTNSHMSVMISRFDEPDKKIRLEGMDIGYGFMEVFNFELIEGRYFSKEFATDDKATILNETAMEMLGIDDPIDKEIMGYKIIGVVKDFHFHSLHHPILALNIKITDKYISQIAVKIKHGKIVESTEFLKQEWEALESDIPFGIQTFDETLSELYYNEKLYANIISFITLIITLIALSGLFGLTLFMTRTKQKEIGIRKVFGAPIASIRKSMIKEFTIQVLIAYVLAIPFSWFLMNEYLQQYAYQTPLKWWLFVIPGILTSAVVLATVLYFISKAARTNVVDVLMEE